MGKRWHYWQTEDGKDRLILVADGDVGMYAEPAALLDVVSDEVPPDFGSSFDGEEQER